MNGPLRYLWDGILVTSNDIRRLILMGGWTIPFQAWCTIKHGESEMNPSIHAGLLSGSWIWIQCDQLSPATVSFFAIVNDNLELRYKETFFQGIIFLNVFHHSNRKAVDRREKTNFSFKFYFHIVFLSKSCPVLIWRVLPSLIASCYTMFDWHPRKTCSFLKRNGGSVDL